ncbi:NUDIX hydrolase [Winogradskya humida]|uniref:NUDIX hydrolase n=1 Tax=Winogradskya humida TaxID=113566 RepID=A0ABQ3ZUA5_9ACTN|nr:NUDIX domain-containing protein [Actinoplanes humidus]GIE22134.1 NUDIX hydrolase [Actinoplanes humidus]
MPKTDYLNDPSAPAANSLVVAVAVVVRDDRGRVLLIRRSDNGLWALPGGAQDLGETVTGAATREVMEETGLDIKVVGISGIYSDPRHVIAYDDGEVRQEFSICLRGQPVAGSLRPSSESTEVQWVGVAELGSLPMHPSMKLRVQHGLEDGDPYID